jgi:hypothetical protein
MRSDELIDHTGGNRRRYHQMPEHKQVHYAFRYGKTEEGINQIIRAAYWQAEVDASKDLGNLDSPQAQIALSRHQRIMASLDKTAQKHAKALATNRYFLDLDCTRKLWNEERQAYA